jgi:hypothetical protein
VETSVNQVSELRAVSKVRNDEISLLWRQKKDLEEETISFKNSTNKLRKQRDGLRTMFDRSQEILKRTLNECKELQRNKRQRETTTVEVDTNTTATSLRSDTFTASSVPVASSSATTTTTTNSSPPRRIEIQEKLKESMIESSSPRKSRETRGTLLRHIASIKGALEGYMRASTNTENTENE